MHGRNALGNRLRECRKKCGMSLKDVSDITGITDSRLSKIENGQRMCPAKELRSLSKAYNESVVSMFLVAGYLNQDDLTEYKYVFRGIDMLSDADISHIQQEINYIVGKKETTL